MQFCSIRSSAQFRDVVRGGARSSGRFAVVYLKPEKPGGCGAEQVALGLIVGKTVGNAVCRNRVRRRLKEIVRHYDPNASSNDANDQACVPARNRALVIRALPSAADAKFDELHRDVTGRIKRLERRLGLVAQ